MKKEQIQRINELYHKQKEQGLTEKEKQEQQQLRTAYIKQIRHNLEQQLEQVSIVQEDGTIQRCKKRGDEKWNH